ncbi:hypothetical protein [Flavobacterium sp. 14A]|uniref:hypothetical protein n=1 Tax=Flavobacterium sp. 14A TaxID=2735896 RepID=UPI00156DDE1B|nr:hypothetical protein [Flavobacterium sp. 14A]NRT11206.1 hypothetical protein [Flavobacterium sp. 14A]
MKNTQKEKLFERSEFFSFSVRKPIRPTRKYRLDFFVSFFIKKKRKISITTTRRYRLTRINSSSLPQPSVECLKNTQKEKLFERSEFFSFSVRKPIPPTRKYRLDFFVSFFIKKKRKITITSTRRYRLTRINSSSLPQSSVECLKNTQKEKLFERSEFFSFSVRKPIQPTRKYRLDFFVSFFIKKKRKISITTTRRYRLTRINSSSLPQPSVECLKNTQKEKLFERSEFFSFSGRKPIPPTRKYRLDFFVSFFIKKKRKNTITTIKRYRLTRINSSLLPQSSVECLKNTQKEKLFERSEFFSFSGRKPIPPTRKYRLDFFVSFFIKKKRKNTITTIKRYRLTRMNSSLLPQSSVECLKNM